METAITPTGRLFRKRLFGYDPIEVDAYLAKAAEAHEAATAEIERLRAAEPLTRVGGDIAGLLTTFAETVTALRDEAAAEVDRTRQEAETYAEARRLEADQLVIDVRDEARSKADALLDHARSEVGAMQDRWRHVERSLGDAASGISAALEAVRRLSGLAGGEPIDVAEAEQAGAEGSGRLRYLLPRLAGGEG